MQPSARALILLAGWAFAVASGVVGAGWEPIGPDGGGVTALAEAPNGRTLYAGSARAGVFKSADGGRSWRRLPERLPEVTALAVDAASSATVYAGTTAGLFQSRDGGATWRLMELNRSNGVFSSRDAGAHWARLGLRGKDAIGVKADAGGEEIVHAVTLEPVNHYGVNKHVLYLRTPATGEFREDLASLGPASGVYVRVAADPKTPGLSYAATSVGLFVQTRAGGAWSGLFGHGAGAMLTSRARPGTIFAVTAPFGDPAILRSRDSGATWERLPAADGYYADVLAVAPAAGPAPRAVYASGRNYDVSGPYLYQDHLRRSTDGGTSWTSIGQGLPAADVTDLELDPEDPHRIFVALLGGGAFRRDL